MRELICTARACFFDLRFVLQHLGKKILQAWILRVRKELLRRVFLQNLPIVHENDPRAHLTGIIVRASYIFIFL